MIPREIIGIGQLGNFCFCGSVSSEELPPDTTWASVQIAKRTYSGSEMQPGWCRQQGGELRVPELQVSGWSGGWLPVSHCHEEQYVNLHWTTCVYRAHRA